MRTLKDLEVEGKRVLTRVDFNVPLQNGQVADDKRIKAALPTIQYLVSHKAKTILISHLGRPNGQVKEDLRMNPVGNRLSTLLKNPVIKLDDCVESEVEKHVAQMENGEVVLLENSRFHPGEEENDHQFSRQLADLADLFINDAFGTAHRMHASTYGVTEFLPSAAGFLIQKEVKMLTKALESPPRPFATIIGGAKVKSKFEALNDMLERVDSFLIGGGVAYTFLKAKGYSIGNSIIEEGMVDRVRSFVKSAYQRGVDVYLPQDVKISQNGDIAIVDTDSIPSGWAGYDIGPATVKKYSNKLDSAHTIVWAGPLGKFENPEYEQGTKQIARKVSKLTALRIIGGGETAAAIEKFGMADQMDHVSTGGGACLAFLRGKELPVLKALR